MIKKINISTDQNNLFAFIDAYYNSSNFVEIKQDKKTLFQGLIHFELQRYGTNHQQTTYKNIKINEFINNLNN
tara:strand:+ start:2965 stop:3183 length:219 start_codon:yes stop_codon:yes gene_type:complete